jgi:hypothetical protein
MRFTNVPVFCLAILISQAATAHGDASLADPTRPATAVARRSHSGALQVQAIITRAGSRTAIVDGRVVHAGDRLANILIEEITPLGVRYSITGAARKRHLQRGFARLPSPDFEQGRVTGAENGTP